LRDFYDEKKKLNEKLKEEANERKRLKLKSKISVLRKEIDDRNLAFR
jgi:hypothetical protein